jgi:hypothetical protein
MHYPIYLAFNLDRFDDILFDESERRLIPENGQVLSPAGTQIIHSDDGVFMLKEPLGEMASNKASCARQQNPHKR